MHCAQLHVACQGESRDNNNNTEALSILIGGYVGHIKPELLLLNGRKMQNSRLMISRLVGTKWPGLKYIKTRWIYNLPFYFTQIGVGRTDNEKRGMVKTGIQR